MGASHEERFTRKKYDNHFQSIPYRGCRMRGKILSLLLFMKKLPIQDLKTEIKKVTKAQPVLVDHHEAHAMSSILTD